MKIGVRAAHEHIRKNDYVQLCVEHSCSRQAYSAEPPVGDPALGSYAALTELLRNFLDDRVSSTFPELFVKKNQIMIDIIVYCFRHTLLTAVELALRDPNFQHNAHSFQYLEEVKGTPDTSASSRQSFRDSALQLPLFQVRLALTAGVQHSVLAKPTNQWLVLATHDGKPLLLAFHSSRLAEESYLWKINLTKALTISRVGTTHCDIVQGISGLGSTGRRKLAFRTHNDQRLFLLELRRLAKAPRFKWSSIQKKQNAQDHYDVKSPVTASFVARAFQPQETLVLKIHEVTGSIRPISLHVVRGTTVSMKSHLLLFRKQD